MQGPNFSFRIRLRMVESTYDESLDLGVVFHEYVQRGVGGGFIVGLVIYDVLLRFVEDKATSG